MVDYGKKIRMLERLKSKQRFCVFCGGNTEGNTVDHVPPIVTFDLRSRPAGYEFLACRECNHGSRRADEVFGLISRFHPGPIDSRRKNELDKLLHSVGQKDQWLLYEMMPEIGDSLPKTPRIPPNTRHMNVSGPILNRRMRTSCGKMGLAFHFRITGEIVPPNGGVFYRWYSNVNRLMDEMPDDFIRLCGPPETLKQGTWSVEKQFTVSTAASPDGQFTGHFSTFRFSFAVLTIAAHDISLLADAPQENVLRPGFLKIESEDF